MYRCDGERTFVILKEEERKTKRKSCCALLKRKIQFLSYYLLPFFLKYFSNTNNRGVAVGGPRALRNLADQLTLFKPGGLIMPPPGFKKLSTPLNNIFEEKASQFQNRALFCRIRSYGFFKFLVF